MSWSGLEQDRTVRVMRQFDDVYLDQGTFYPFNQRPGGDQTCCLTGQV